MKLLVGFRLQIWRLQCPSKACLPIIEGHDRICPTKKNSVSWSARRKWNEAELCTLTMEGQPQHFSLPVFSMGCGSLEDSDGWQVTVDLSCNWRIGSDRVEALWAQWVGGHSKVWTWGDSVTDQGVTVNRPVKGKIYEVHVFFMPVNLRFM